MSRRTLTFVLLFLALVGIADALYLTYDHGAFNADPGGYTGGLCGVHGGCAISRSSVLSEIPLPGEQLGLPTSVLALGFYVVFIVLTLMRFRASRAAAGTGSGSSLAAESLPPIARLQLALALLATMYSVFLLAYSLAQGSVCKFCAVLYVVNAGLLFVTWRALGESLATAARAVMKAVASRFGLIAAVVMVVVLASSYIIYRGVVLAARDDVPVVTLDTTGRPSTGPTDAQVQIVEFADFECPHCKASFQALEQVLAERKDVRLTFLHFPLDQACNPVIDRAFHARACELAVIGECAHAQGKFYDAAETIFAGAPTPALLDALAAKGIDRPKLDACIADGKALAQVQSDIRAGLAAKIEGTPAIFLNGALVGGALPKDKLLSLIDLAKEASTFTAPHPQ